MVSALSALARGVAPGVGGTVIDLVVVLNVDVDVAGFVDRDLICSVPAVGVVSFGAMDSSTVAPASDTTTILLVPLHPVDGSSGANSVVVTTGT